MSTSQSNPSIDSGSEVDPGLIADAILSRPRHGARAVLIRKIALRYPELSHRQIAARVGCHPSNVDQILGRFLGKELGVDVEEYQSVKASALEAVQFRTLASITDADISNASLLQRITAVAIMEDKIRLVRGQPTSMHMHVLMDVANMMRERREVGSGAATVLIGEPSE